jgi:hypothetical protein
VEKRVHTTIHLRKSRQAWSTKFSNPRFGTFSECNLQTRKLRSQSRMKFNLQNENFQIFLKDLIRRLQELTKDTNVGRS